MKNFIFYIGIMLVLGFALGFFSVNWILSLICIAAVASAYLFILFSPILFTNDISKTEKFLIKNRKKPFYDLNFSIANNLENDVEDAIQKVLSKYKAPFRHALFLTIYSLYKHDTEKAKTHLEGIQPLKYREYYRALVCVEEGNLQDAVTISNKINSPKWMKLIIMAEVYLKEGNNEKAKICAIQAVKETKGLQKYAIYKNFEKILGDQTM
ncbi:hypothetical protein BIV60_20285 [Bacillus sp. MUM 116]|uniref:hypothetical protein n=1 Tax=Bacillus sp. MUM 116 TaxID=1678002 RepID=UPI0008F5E739|nr:hypothetical protein [Bacillus sp. MUM 116]OIK10810.1 hypothetical protein BIV60_20285 [Bacillus sp. MUM 116]